MEEVPFGDVGELCVKGPGVMTCYYNDPKATEETIVDGWLRTGDMAMQDEDGFYFLVDRKKDVIVSGGENIYPVQIENFLSGYEKVNDVAVIGLPDPRLGEITGAIISIKNGMTCTEEEIEAFCKGLPRYKRPKKLIFADSKSVSSFKGIPGFDTTGRRLKISNVCIAPYTSQIAADLSIHEGIKNL